MSRAAPTGIETQWICGYAYTTISGTNGASLQLRTDNATRAELEAHAREHDRRAEYERELSAYIRAALALLDAPK